MPTKTFELSVLLSVIGGCNLLDVTEEDKNEVVSFIHGKPVDQSDCETMFETATQHIVQLYPRLEDAARLIQNLLPDQARYNKLIDLFKKWFDLSPMEVLTV